MNRHCHIPITDHGSEPYVENLEEISLQNCCFRAALWTGQFLQMTVMCIPSCKDIGLEMHPDTDQLIRIEQGTALIKMGTSKDQLSFCQKAGKGAGIFVPAGIWHNICNIGKYPLKLSSVYAPPHHPMGTKMAVKKTF